ncbi:hypothetical protein HMPREF1981_02823 [Bacteroides pyogenes F0041]|uniref:Uncharacterized protein n=1 Tax=Bacteroides pyogenes F0041 TaxID=1321819 RepID=U2DQ91_9BACE|nr:hypothetical protein HMPREF1981_02823 [Bacteroides pyogenes F0041]GAE23736.1 hypothetical protein JCM10003_3554 [Bacteroides pyogenes JCM 10003]
MPKAADRKKNGVAFGTGSEQRNVQGLQDQRKTAPLSGQVTDNEMCRARETREEQRCSFRTCRKQSAENNGFVKTAQRVSAYGCGQSSEAFS